MINYTPFGHSDWQLIVSDIKKYGAAGKRLLFYQPSTVMQTFHSIRNYQIRASVLKTFLLSPFCIGLKVQVNFQNGQRQS